MAESQCESCCITGDLSLIAQMKRFAHEAMATTFEVIVVHEDRKYAQQAAAAAFDQVDRLEAELSRFVENSDVSRINNLPTGAPLILGLDAFECLRLSVQIYCQTGGAFDVTIGPLMACWRDSSGASRTPGEQELEAARGRVGADSLLLDEGRHTVELLKAPVQVDLGGIGKGYAVDRMGEVLREWDVPVALVHGGYSSVLALDAPPGMKGWPLTFTHPQNGTTIARVQLCHRALSSSGVRKGQHIIDPRTGRPVDAKLAAWSSARDAATADALSTAFMIMDVGEIERYCSTHSDATSLLILGPGGEGSKADQIVQFGPWSEIEA